jgi:hypothetical protein
VESNAGKWAPGHVGAKGRGRGFGAARSALREGIGKGGAAAFAPRQRESGGRVRAHPCGKREKERGGPVRLGSAWREGGVGEGGLVAGMTRSRRRQASVGDM